MDQRGFIALAALCIGCGGNTVDPGGSDGGGAGSRCDPSTLADAGVEDSPPATSGPYVVDLAIGEILHQCARMSDDTVRCRGFNHAGQLGLGTSGSSLGESTPVPGLVDVAQVVTSGSDVTCTRHRDGTVRCWGSNEHGMIGAGHDGDETCAGLSTSRPCRTRPTLVPGLTDVVDLAAGMFAVCAVRRDGSVWCWGDVDLLLPSEGSPTPVRTGRFNDVTAMWSTSFGWIVRLRDGRYSAVSLLGSVFIPAQAELGEVSPANHVCYRLPDGSVRCLGSNAFGKVGNGTASYPAWVLTPSDPGLCGVRSVSIGAYNSCAVLADRTASCWGDTRDGALGAEAMDACPGINMPSTCATRPTPVEGLDHIDRLFVGTWGSCAIRTDRSVWCWGTLSPGSRDRRPAPVAW